MDKYIPLSTKIADRASHVDVYLYRLESIAQCLIELGMDRAGLQIMDACDGIGELLNDIKQSASDQLEEDFRETQRNVSSILKSLIGD